VVGGQLNRVHLNVTLDFLTAYVLAVYKQSTNLLTFDCD